jgi:hypothetical protein
VSPRYGTPDQLVNLLESQADLLDEEPPESFSHSRVCSAAERLHAVLSVKLGIEEEE